MKVNLTTGIEEYQRLEEENKKLKESVVARTERLSELLTEKADFIKELDKLKHNYLYNENFDLLMELHCLINKLKGEKEC